MIGFIDAYISKLSILFKIKLRQQHGLWKEDDTHEMLKTLFFGENSLDSKSINIHIENLKADSGFTIKKQINHDGSHQFADKILNNMIEEEE